MVFPVVDVVAFVSHIMTLEPGDLVLTGTPAGVGKLSPGDEVEVVILGPEGTPGSSATANKGNGGAVLSSVRNLVTANPS
jgi:2-keto-4-pentenoate hydratase/2-oxohepta-3-ene-1,7-dioic acid hydratase in catechol pathway